MKRRRRRICPSRRRRDNKQMKSWIVAACIAAGVATVHGQWQDAKTPGAPRDKDGKVVMTAPAPRLDGKPDLSGVWQVEGEPRGAGALFGIGESINSRYFR